MMWLMNVSTEMSNIVFHNLCGLCQDFFVKVANFSVFPENKISHLLHFSF